MPDLGTQNGTDDPLFAIGILAEKVGLSVSAVRKYESEGLLVAHRTVSGHRLFSHEDVNRVRNIRYLIQGLGLNIEGIRRMQSLLPCWNLLPCSAEARANCPAHRDSARPCWVVRGLSCEFQADECRRCVVYRFGSLCIKDIKRLLHDQHDFQDTGEAVRELLQRLKDSRQES